MCELYLKPDEKTVLIEIKDIHKLSGAKYDASIAALTKALGYDSARQQKEVSPFRSVRDLEKISKDRAEEGLLKLWDAISRTWINVEKAKGADTFILNSRIFINPKTKKPLTNAQWGIIKKDILSSMDFLYAYEEERIATHAMALGKVLKGLPIDTALNYTYKTLQSQVDAAVAKLSSSLYQNTLAFAQQEAGAMIVELKQKQYKAVHGVIQNSIKQRHSSGQLTENLYDTFGNMNRDWRRIAETEIGNAQNNGQLVTELDRRVDADEYLFMKGIASSEACPWCRNEVDGKIVVLLEDPPDSGGDTMMVNGESYTVIWPGKSNYGRARRNWWVAAGTQHPHCILPGQEISAALPSSVMQSRYKGRIIEIGLSDGHSLAVTENHPILTPDGFVAAKFLTKGIEVFRDGDGQGVMESINPDYHQRPIFIEDFYTSALHASSVSAAVMPISPEDFHSDARRFNGKVNVVNTYGLLGSNLEAALFQHRYENAFGFVDYRELFSSDSIQMQARARFHSSPSGFMRFLDEEFSSLQGSGGHTGVHALATIPWNNIGFEKAISEGSPTHTDFSRELLLRFSSAVPAKNNIGKLDRVLVEERPFLIPVTVTHISSNDYDGPVYDLTDDIYGIYTCNSVVVKNCRCTWVKHIPGFEKWDDKFRVAMNQARAEGAKRQKLPDDYESTLKPTPWN